MHTPGICDNVIQRPSIQVLHGHPQLTVHEVSIAHLDNVLVSKFLHYHYLCQEVEGRGGRGMEESGGEGREGNGGKWRGGNVM